MGITIIAEIAVIGKAKTSTRRNGRSGGAVGISLAKRESL
jgi:hypothetical protein